MNRVILFFGLLLSTSSFATTYTYTGPTYTAGVFTGTGTPAYTPSMQLSGSITTASPLPANLSLTDIGPAGSNLIQSWSFNDGLYTYTPATSSMYQSSFVVSTDNNSNIIQFIFEFFSPGPPNTIGQLVNVFKAELSGGNAFTTATSQATCDGLDPTNNNACVGINGTPASQMLLQGVGTFATGAAPPPPPPPPPPTTPVAAPALSDAALIGLIAFLLAGGLLGLAALRRRQAD